MARCRALARHGHGWMRLSALHPLASLRMILSDLPSPAEAGLREGGKPEVIMRLSFFPWWSAKLGRACAARMDFYSPLPAARGERSEGEGALPRV